QGVPVDVAVIGQYVQFGGFFFVGGEAVGNGRGIIVHVAHRHGEGGCVGEPFAVADGVDELLLADKIGCGRVNDRRAVVAGRSALVGRAHGHHRQRIAVAVAVVAQHSQDVVAAIFVNRKRVVGGPFFIVGNAVVVAVVVQVVGDAVAVVVAGAFNGRCHTIAVIICIQVVGRQIAVSVRVVVFQ